MANTTYSAVNKHTDTLAAGCPVATHASGVGFIPASAADNSKPAVAIVASDVPTGTVASASVTGIVSLADWTAVTGSPALSPRATYFLGTTPGALTTTPPALAGQVVQKVGRAVSPTDLDLTVSEPILL